MKVKTVAGIFSIMIFFVFIILISFIFMKKFGHTIGDPLMFRQTIGEYGMIAYGIYFLLYLFQIFFAPIPGQVLNVASGMLFGTFRGFLVSWLAVIVGGFLAMLFSRYFGKKLLNWFFEEKALRFERTITRRGLSLIIFLAIFPNPLGDGLFYLAGLTHIPLKILISLIAICRIPGILIYVIAGNKIISAGIRGWIIAGIGLFLVILLYYLCRNKIETIFERYLFRLSLWG
ncbi:MAG: TVP38/TMEM64 family protein [bacterium]